MELLHDFQQYLKDNLPIAEGQTVLLAVSGGVDSMVMAHLFKNSNINFAIAHCNFRLRGADADGDEALVKKTADEYMSTFHSTGFDTKKISEEWGKGIQETARILRYEWLENIREEHKYAYIATAHHADDNVETLLMHLFKGTGISGLHGIPVKNGNIIRPLLFANKEIIREYAATHNISFREDASNATDHYLRNAIRHRLVPVIKELVPNAVQNMQNSIERFTETEILYNKSIEKERKSLTSYRGKDLYIPVLKLQHRIPLQTICYELFQPYGFTSAQIPHIIQLLSADTGHFIASSTHRIIRNRDFLIVTAAQHTDTDLITIEAAPCDVKATGHHFSFSIADELKTIPTEKDIACIDMDKIAFPLVLRKWRKGDYFYPIGMGMKKKKLSNFLIDQKIPLHEKENVWILESQKRIVWVAGMRPDERFKIKDSTKKILLVKRSDA